MEKHLKTHELMEGAQRGAHSGCSGMVDNLLIDRTVTLNGHWQKPNLRMAWIDIKKVYDSLGHSWLEGMMILHRFPVSLSQMVVKLSKCWNTKVVATTKQGLETSEPIRFLPGYSQFV